LSRWLRGKLERTPEVSSAAVAKRRENFRGGTGELEKLRNGTISDGGERGGIREEVTLWNRNTRTGIVGVFTLGKLG